MKVIYKGDYEIKFLSNEYCGIVKPNDSFDISDELYNSEYKNDPRFEGSKKETKKSKGAE